jgi:hypothetical protein
MKNHYGTGCDLESLVKYRFPRHFPKFLGYIVGRYDIGGLDDKGQIGGRGKIGKLGIVEDDCVAINVSRLFEMARDSVERSALSLQRLQPSLIIPGQQRFHLANIRTFNQCGQLAQLLGIPICFLTLEDMAKHNKNGEIQRMTKAAAYTYMERIAEFHEIYRALAQNILHLIRGEPLQRPSPHNGASLIPPSHLLKSRSRFVSSVSKHKQIVPAGKRQRKAATPTVTKPDNDESEEIVSVVRRSTRHIVHDDSESDIMAD